MATTVGLALAVAEEFTRIPKANQPVGIARTS